MKNKKNRLIPGLLMSVIVLAAPLTMGGQRSDDPCGVAVSPQQLLLGTVQSGVVKVHTDIPLFAVNPYTLKLNGIPAIGCYADALGQVVAVFSEYEVKSIVAPPRAVMTLTGEYVTGDSFAGSDTVTVTPFRGK